MNNFYTNLITGKKLSLLSIGFFFIFFATAQVFIKPFSYELLSNILSGENIPPVSNTDELSIKKGFLQEKVFDVNGADKKNIASLLTLNAAKNARNNTFIKDNTVASTFIETLAGPGGPILVVTSTSNLFSTYAAEILQAEGLNEYATSDVGALSTSMLSGYDVVVVGDIALTDAQVNLLSNWTTAGGTLITFSPDSKLAPLLGLNPTGNTLANRYLLVNTSTGPGKGIVNQTMQYQSVADLYTLNGATSLATLYSTATTATNNPAVTIRNVGTEGGKAVAFTYDLARSIVYTRQGNPDWAGTERDGQAGPIRSDDQFYPDWIDLNKVAIPQADEQQRLFVNIILQSSRKPMPRFWYLPRGLKAAVVMTGDDHGNGGTKARFNQYLQASSDNSADAVADWRAIRGTSYIYTNTPISDNEARAFEQQGFEIALHLSTNCDNYTPATLERDLTEQLASFGARFPSVAAPVTNRTHCIAWSDWHTQPQLEAPKGIRLDANYYYWPGEWVQDRPGMFSGSGIPMRFTQLNGTLIDCYQLTTQMTDESDQSYPYHINQLLDKALGPEGYYGVFCANMHTDADFSDGSDAIVASAKARNVPVISSKQLLTWLDGRNGSSFGGMSWNGTQLNFSASVASGARSLQGMLPITEATGQLVSLTVNGTSVAYRIEKIKGIEYAFFTCTPGNYVATYDPNSSPNNEPIVAITSPANNASFTAPASITINANATDSDGTISKVEFFQGPAKLGEDSSSPYSFVWNNVAGGTYSLTAKATDNLGLVTTSEAVSITVAAACPCSVFQASDAPAGGAQGNPYYDGGPIEVGMKFRSSVNGNVTGVRFYKQTGNTGTHIGRLYSSAGNLLAEAPFVSETATGWQQVNFASAVPITANTVYIVSYHSSNGFYSGSNSYFGSAINRPPLSALANSESVNGVYKYGEPGFPTESFGSSNYWVDVVFNNGTPPANQLPTVAISSPANNATFTAPATINITATASDADGTVTKVEFFQGNTLLGEDASSPYTFSWAGVAAGTYSLTAKATDNLGGVKTSDVISVKVNALPTVSITAPANGATFTAPATITINATAADADGTIAKVEFFQGSTPGSTTKIGEDTSGPFTVNWSNVPAGNYTLTAIATDNNEGTTTSAAVSITVNPPANQAPTVSITSPANGATFTAPATINLTANAADADGTVSRVEFFNGSTSLGVDSDGSNGWSFSWINVAAGGYTLTAKATDNSGAATTSAVVSITVNPPANQAPTVSITSPADGATFTAPATIAINATAADEDGTVTKVEFFQGASKIGEDLNSPYTFSWSDVTAGTYSLTAKATDNAGGVTTSTAVNIAVNAPNNQAPTVSITSPVNGATFTAPATISITANAADADGSVAKVDFYNGATLLGTATTSPYSFSWTNVVAGTYTLTARATDNAGGVTNSAVVNVTVNNVSAGCPCTVFKPTDAPAGGPISDGRALQLGMKFRSSVNGYVTGVRFYKEAGNNGTHIGQLYSNTGTLLAQVTFVNETASGWQQMDFPTAVPINANTTYTISYHSSTGTYSARETAFSQAIVNGPLTGLRNGTDGPNGVYRYTNVPARPNTGYRSSNYFVDAVFNTSIPSANTAVALTSLKAPSMAELQQQEEFEVYPNPFSGMATVSFVLDKNDTYTVGLYDAKGRMVELLKQGQAKSGESTTFAVDGSKLAKGLYLVRLQTSNGIKVKKLVLDK